MTSFGSHPNVVLVMAYGSLVFVLLFIFVKRQVMRLAMTRRGPHVPLGHNAPKELKQEIEAKLCHVQKIHFEPRLLTPDDDRLHPSGESVSYDYLYRMKALDAIRETDFPFRELGGASTAVTGKRFRTWLLQIRNSQCMFRDKRNSLIYTVLDGYNKARHGAEIFGKTEFLKYQEALAELAAIVKSGSGSALADHQSAARHLASPPEPAGPSTSVSQNVYLTSVGQQRTKKPRSFSELKSLKENYNTLDNAV